MGRNMLFSGALPPEMPQFLGGHFTVPETGNSANTLTTMSNVGDVGEHVHTYMLVV